MIDQPQDPLAASLRLQLEGDIRLQCGDYELVFEDRFAVVRPTQKKSLASFVLGPIFAACILIVFWLSLLLIPSVTAKLVFGVFLLLFTAVFVSGVIGMYRDFRLHRLLPPLLSGSAERIELPQIGTSIPLESVLAIFIIRVPLKVKRTNESCTSSGSFDQAGMIHRNEDGGVSSLVLASRAHYQLSGLWAALEELAKIHSIRFIEQEWPWSQAVDRFRLDRIIAGKGRRLFKGGG